MTRRLLLVTYYFPPLSGSGVFRPLRMAKHLPRHGWDVTVLSVSENTRAPKDPSLLREIPPQLRVERTPSAEPRTLLIALNKLGLRGLVRRLEPWLMLPDDQRGWVPFAARRAKRLVRESHFDAVVTTSAPYSAHLVGQRLKRHTGIPWIADFRDEWTTNPYLRDRYPTNWHLNFSRSMEREVLRQADRVVCVSRPWLDALHGLVPELPDDKFVVLPNGYDGEHFRGKPPARPDRFRIVYSGAFYGPRSPGPFLEALDLVRERRRIPADEIEVVFMGHTGWSDRVEGDSLRSSVRIVKHRPYFESLEVLREAAVLLLVIPREGGAGNHTGKLFPYLASGRPILATAPEPNVAAELIRESRSGIVAPPDDPAAIAAAIESLYEDWKRGVPQRQDRELIARYEAGFQAGEWAGLLEQISDSRPNTTPTDRLAGPTL